MLFQLYKKRAHGFQISEHNKGIHYNSCFFVESMSKERDIEKELEVMKNTIELIKKISKKKSWNKKKEKINIL